MSGSAQWQWGVIIAAVVAAAGFMATIWRLGTLAGTFAQKVDGLTKSIDALREDFERSQGVAAKIVTRMAVLETRVAHIEHACDSCDAPEASPEAAT